MNTISSFPDANFNQLSNDELAERIVQAKKKLGKDLLILGHHYQRDEIIAFADVVGDSLELSKKAAHATDAKYIVFCGVHFMAESADILSSDVQYVILPDVEAGCSMADMADKISVEKAWSALHTIINPKNNKIIPITYVNSTADLKAFCGKHDGATCTSSNASQIIKWAFQQGERLFFFPDQHLGRNTCFELGIPLDKMILWDPNQELGGNTIEDIENASVILWKGFCCVHQQFGVEKIAKRRAEYPDIKVVVHPECPHEVVQAAEVSGSTGKIVNLIEHAPKGEKWAIGTETHLVNRLKNTHKDRLFITSISDTDSYCNSMGKIKLSNLAWVLEHLMNGKIMNQICVEKETKQWAIKALDRMLGIT